VIEGNAYRLGLGCLKCGMRVEYTGTSGSGLMADEVSPAPAQPDTAIRTSKCIETCPGVAPTLSDRKRSEITFCSRLTSGISARDTCELVSRPEPCDISTQLNRIAHIEATTAPTQDRTKEKSEVLTRHKWPGLPVADKTGGPAIRARKETT
jgi:hypothetical protein